MSWFVDLASHAVYRCGENERLWNILWIVPFASKLKFGVSGLMEPVTDLLFGVPVSVAWSEPITRSVHSFPPAVSDVSRPKMYDIQVLVKKVERNHGKQHEGLQAL